MAPASMRVKDSFLPLRFGQTSPSGLSRQASRITSFMPRRLGRRHDPLDQHAVGHGAGGAVDLGIDGGEDVALLRTPCRGRRRTPAPGPRPSRCCSSRVSASRNRFAVEIEAARLLAVAGDHLEAVIREQLRHARRIAHGIVERVEPER